MTRQFFVGGNFKLNPSTLAASSSLIGGLNSAELDPATGAREIIGVKFSGIDTYR